MHERDADVVERHLERRLFFAQTSLEALDQTGNGIDGKGGLGKPRGLRRQVDGGQFVEAHHMVHDHDLGGNLGQALAGFGQCFGGICQLVTVIRHGARR